MDSIYLSYTSTTWGGHKVEEKLHLGVREHKKSEHRWFMAYTIHTATDVHVNIKCFRQIMYSYI
jgi:hypothetical protein